MEFTSQQTHTLQSDNLVNFPLLSVCIVTYNHCRYIKNAIEGVLAQKCSFTFEILIADDCSQDGTIDIITAYQSNYPAQIKLLLAKSNLGRYTGNGRLNMLRALRASRGRYLALLEGDDFWTCENKLQLQVQQLEEDAAISAVCHNVHLMSGANLDGILSSLDTPAFYSFEQLLKGNLVATGSLVIRRSLVENIPDWYLFVPFLDWILCLQCACAGKLLFLPEVMGVYRLHENGVWAKAREDLRLRDVAYLKSFKIIYSKFPAKYRINMLEIMRELTSRLFLGELKNRHAIGVLVAIKYRLFILRMILFGKHEDL